jgi:hypothetical protein
MGTGIMPPTNILTRTWLVLIGLTLASLLAGRAAGGGTLGLGGAAAVLAIGGFKATQILRHFLGISRAGTGWQVGFALYLTLLGGVILAAYALTPLS